LLQENCISPNGKLAALEFLTVDQIALKGPFWLGVFSKVASALFETQFQGTETRSYTTSTIKLALIFNPESPAFWI
jgi:hypothetical protein